MRKDGRIGGQGEEAAMKKVIVFPQFFERVGKWLSNVT
jgi:hypothetical protein